MRSPLADRGWEALDAATLAPVAHVPTMLSPEERQLYYWLAREALGGAGAICDLGSFVGGSAAHLVLGMIDGGHRGRVHLFDRFTADPRTKARVLLVQGIPQFEGEDILSLSRSLLAPFAARLRWHRGDVTGKVWPAGAGPIRLMTLDICKLPEVADQVALRFMPHLSEGAIVVQQDFCDWNQPWTPVQMLRLSRWLEPLRRVRASVVFRVTRVPDAGELAAAAIAPLDDAALTAELMRAQVAFAKLGVEAVLDAQLAAVAANPGIRKPWQMRHPTRR